MQAANERVFLMEKGTSVRIVLSEGHALLTTKWFPKTGATGTVERVFKNGRVAVAVNEVRNFSNDGLKTLHFEASEVEEITSR